MNSCREKNLQLTRMTVAVAMMMIMSTILCLKKKKEKKKTKKKNFNKLQKAFQSNKKKEKVKKDTLEIESKEKEKLLTSNQPAETINNKQILPSDDKKKKKAHYELNVSPNQFGGVDIYGDQFGPFHGSDEKEAFYPSVAEPTASTKRKREEELEKDKEEKIKQGFYQSRSDEDDTLEPIKSLKDEETDPADKTTESKKIKTAKTISLQANLNEKLKSHADDEKENEKMKE